VQGSTIQVDSEITTSDAVIDMNDGEGGAGVSLGYSGLNVDRGTENNYWLGFDEVRDRFTVGQIATLDAANIATTQVVATREDTPTVNGLPYWDDTNNRFSTSANATLTSAGDLYVANEIALSSTMTISTNRLISFTGGNAFISGSGNVSIGTNGETGTFVFHDDQLRVSDGAGAVPSYSFKSATSTGMYLNASGELVLDVINTDMVVISDTAISLNAGVSFGGDLLISKSATGSESPSFDLDLQYEDNGAADQTVSVRAVPTGTSTYISFIDSRNGELFSANPNTITWGDGVNTITRSGSASSYDFGGDSLISLYTGSST